MTAMSGAVVAKRCTLSRSREKACCRSPVRKAVRRADTSLPDPRLRGLCAFPASAIAWFASKAAGSELVALVAAPGSKANGVISASARLMPE